MSIHLSQKTETLTSYDIQPYGPVAMVRKFVETKVNNKATSVAETFFVDRRIAEPKKPTPSKVDKAPKFYYLTADDLVDLWVIFESGVECYEVWRNIIAKNDALQGIGGLDKQNFYRMQWEELLLWRAGEDTPTSIPVFVDYSQGITDDKFNLDAAEKTLSLNVRVQNLKRISIPYYNKEEGQEYALQFSYEFSQKGWNELYRNFRGPGCFLSWVRENLKGWRLDEHNPLKLKKAFITAKRRR